MCTNREDACASYEQLPSHTHSPQRAITPSMMLASDLVTTEEELAANQKTSKKGAFPWGAATGWICLRELLGMSS